MNRYKCSLIIVIIFLAAPVKATSPISKFDEFGDINCEDEYARLDNFAIQLQNTPSAQGYIIFYGGRRFRGRLPRVGEAAARAGRLKPYLVNRRGIPTDRVVVINGGYQESFVVELWIVPPGAEPPKPSTITVPAKQIRFKKGKVNKRQFQCNI
jgi:hypothetical protein